jgi:hypothetical protein
VEPAKRFTPQLELQSITGSAVAVGASERADTAGTGSAVAVGASERADTAGTGSAVAIGASERADTAGGRLGAILRSACKTGTLTRTL